LQQRLQRYEIQSTVDSQASQADSDQGGTQIRKTKNQKENGHAERPDRHQAKANFVLGDYPRNNASQRDSNGQRKAQKAEKPTPPAKTPAPALTVIAGGQG